MKPSSSTGFRLIFITLVLVVSVAQDFDFYYLVLQWPGSYCDTRRGCCYPQTGKPQANFTIHGLWPNYNDGGYPANCNPKSRFDFLEIKDLLKELQKEWPSLACPSSNGVQFWTHEWEKHGTCAEAILDQHSYFETTLNLKRQIDLLGILENAGIVPDGNFYTVNSISEAISEATGFTPVITCNRDEGGNRQLSEIYFCVDTSGAHLIECPLIRKRTCPPSVEFPSF